MKVQLAHGPEVDLSALDVTNLPVGAKITASDTGSVYTLTVSSAAVDHDATESVANATSLRWIKDGTVVTTSSFSSLESEPAWVKTARARATALNGAAFDSEWKTDFCDGNWSALATASSGTAAVSPTVAGGVVVLTTAAANGSSALVGPPTSALIASVLTSKLYVRWRIKFVGPTGANIAARLGVIDPDFSSGPGKGFWFGINGTAETGGSNTNWASGVLNGVSEVVTASSTAFISGSWVTVEMYLDGAGGASWYVNGVLIASQTITNSNVGAIAGTPYSRAYSFSAAHTVQVDKMYAAFTGQ